MATAPRREDAVGVMKDPQLGTNCLLEATKKCRSGVRALIVNRHDLIEETDVAADRRLHKIGAVADPHERAEPGRTSRCIQVARLKDVAGNHLHPETTGLREVILGRSRTAVRSWSPKIVGLEYPAAHRKFSLAGRPSGRRCQAMDLTGGGHKQTSAVVGHRPPSDVPEMTRSGCQRPP